MGAQSPDDNENLAKKGRSAEKSRGTGTAAFPGWLGLEIHDNSIDEKARRG